MNCCLPSGRGDGIGKGESDWHTPGVRAESGVPGNSEMATWSRIIRLMKTSGAGGIGVLLEASVSPCCTVGKDCHCFGGNYNTEITESGFILL